MSAALTTVTETSRGRFEVRYDDQLVGLVIRLNGRFWPVDFSGRALSDRSFDTEYLAAQHVPKEKGDA